MQYIPILSIASIILGLYIFGSLFLDADQANAHKQQFHMGCFLTQHNLSHSHMIESTITLMNKNKFKIVNVSRSFDQELINSKLVQLAHSFEFYIQQYTKQKQERNTYAKLSRAVAKSYESYKNCSKGLNELTDFEQKRCIETWTLQQNCSRKIQILKQQLSFLLLQKEERQQSIRQAVNLGKLQSNKAKKMSDTFEKQFKRKDKQLELQQKNIEANIKYVGQKIISLQYNFAVAQNQTIHSVQLYKECSQHRKQFQLCEQLSKQVRNLGHGTLQNLSEKVEKKRISIMRIQSMVSDEQNTNDKRQLQHMQNRGMEQYRKLHKIFIETKAKMSKNCGCTDKEQQKLYQILQTHIKEQEQLKKQLIELQERESAQLASLQIVKERRRELENELRVAGKVNVREQEKQVERERMQHLRELEHQILILSKKALNYGDKFNALQDQCNKSKEQLASYLANIEQILSCQMRRKYFEAMETQLEKENKKLTLDAEGKDKLIQQLKQLIL